MERGNSYHEDTARDLQGQANDAEGDLTTDFHNPIQSAGAFSLKLINFEVVSAMTAKS